MPRYLIVTASCTPAGLLRAADLLGARFPEVSLESHRLDGDDHARMVCTAPSAEHARRWLGAADIRIDSITNQHRSDPRRATP